MDIFVSCFRKPLAGLLVYINGVKVAESLLPTLINTTYSLCAGIILGANINHDEESFLLMYLSAFDIMNTYVESKQLMDYAPPILKDNFIITFSSLDGDSLTNHPNIKVDGAVTENRGVLVLNGMQTFLYDTGDFKDTFVMMPFLSDAGLT
ncbi:uncharacterized protein LOC136082662 [Hydra vulgaris]|uniref:Uncharacterized protein LOC136082662 n=1 Tax=Hydra vulgaris TaxID=6087 RepID=A0ABM4C923_HYDVU